MEKVWVLLLVGYLMMIRTAERRNAAGAVLCFLEGAYLAMLCFAVLPPAMGAARFWGAAGCAAAGCGTGLLAEKYLPWDVLLRRALFLFLTAAVCFSWEIPVFPLAFLGIVPKEEEVKEKFGPYPSRYCPLDYPLPARA